MHKLHSVTTIRLIARMCSGFIAACSICFTAGWKCKWLPPADRRRLRRPRLALGAVLRLAALDAKAGRQWAGGPTYHSTPLTLETTVAGFRVSRVFLGPSLHTHNTHFFSRVCIRKKTRKPGNTT